MGQKLVVGPFNKGFRNDVTGFNIDNDSFPTLINAYQWRGRVKRKRGTSFLNRLNRAFGEVSIGVTGASPWTFNLFTLLSINPVLEPNAEYKIGSAVIVIQSTPQIIFTDQGDGTLTAIKKGDITGATNAADCQITSNGHTLSNGDLVTIEGVDGMVELNGNTYTIAVVDANNFTLGVDSTGFGVYTPATGTWTSPDPTNTGTINYLTGSVTLTGTFVAGVAAIATFSYYPVLPVMGLETFSAISTQFPGTIAFDTRYAYNITPAFPYSIYNVSYYKNPSADPVNLPGYVPKTTWTPLNWNGENYQQFWSHEYQGALWVTNGIEVPFDPTNLGMQYKPILTVTVLTPTTANLQIVGHGLVVGDFVFVNEVVTTTGINFQTGYVTTVTDANNVIVTFPTATLATNGTGGIAQYLTSTADPLKDPLRWFDGDPTDGNATNPGFVQGKGWVNFSPPLSQLNFSIANKVSRQYYLVGARLIFAYKDRLIFFGPVIQTSSAGSQLYLQDTFVYSQNGTAFYTASFTNAGPTYPLNPTSISTVLAPNNQTATPSAYFEDQVGFGGNNTLGLDQPILTVSNNEDNLIIGLTNTQARIVYSGNDLVPFNVFTINSELGTGSTFSVINFDEGVMTRGQRGITMTSQNRSSRIDLKTPDEVFQLDLLNNGNERFTSQRDFVNEWVYYTYTSNELGKNFYDNLFPNQTLQYNYRNQSWSVNRESYTHYGNFQRLTGFIWSTVGTVYPTWRSWNEPWNAGTSTLLQTEVIAGNQQGFVVFRDDGTNESQSLTIQDIVGNQVTSPDHTLSVGDYITISGAQGTVAPQVNGKIFSVGPPIPGTVDPENKFTLNPTISGGTYLGGGLIKRMYVPFIQTKQFPAAWDLGRKTRIGVQQYLLTSTFNSEIQLLIYLSQNNTNPWNSSEIVPSTNSVNNGLIYSSVLYTCPESTNLGLTPANTNLQQLTQIDSTGASSNNQDQIWHRVNTSLIGDTIQLGFTMSDEQMRNPDFKNQFSEIELHGFILDLNPSQLLS